MVTALQGISSEARYGNGFSETFGFNRFNLEEGPRQLNRKQFMAHLSQPIELQVSEYDFVTELEVRNGHLSESEYNSLDLGEYQILWNEEYLAQLELSLNLSGETVLTFDLSELREISPLEYTSSIELPIEDLTFVEENEQVRIAVVVTKIIVSEDRALNATFYLLIGLK